MFAAMGPHPMARGVPKNFRNRVGSLAAGNSPTNAVTTTDISLTVGGYDHAGLGSPPSTKPQACRAASECPPRRCSFPRFPGRIARPADVLRVLSRTVLRGGGPKALRKSRPLQCCASAGERAVRRLMRFRDAA